MVSFFENLILEQSLEVSHLVTCKSVPDEGKSQAKAIGQVPGVSEGQPSRCG